MDMAYYGKALVVSRSAVSEVEFRDVVGGSKERELPPVIFQITAESSPNDKPTGARWLAEIATKRSSLAAGRAMNLLSEAYTIANKSDHDAAKVEALLFIAQQFLKFDRERAFDILSEALKTVNRVEPKPLPPMKPGDSTIRTISFTMVNGKERSTALRPTLNSIDFNEVADFVQLDYVQTSGLGDNLKDHLLRAKYFIAVSRSVLGVPRTGTGYEPSLDDILRPN